MNPRQRSLRSSTRSTAPLTTKRPSQSDSQERHHESPKPTKRPKNKTTQPQRSRPSQPLSDERVVLPNQELLTKASEPSNYHRALLLKRDQDEELLNLDQSLSVSFSKSDNNEEAPKARLQKVLRWKLLRGQYRATLPALVAQNSSEDVDRVVHKALDQLASCHTVDQALQSKALSTMCELKGVGPATAAAFLSFEFPSLIPVFSDEAASFYEKEIGSIKYTPAFYKKFAALMQVKTEKISTSGNTWDVNRLERALWTLKMLRKHLSDLDWIELMGTQDII